MDFRKLDALVAEKIMGCVVAYMSEQDVEPSIVVDQATAHFDVLPHYSADIAAAWTVWDRLYEVGKWCCMAIRHPVAEGFEVALTEWESDHVRPSILVSDIDTAPLAICLAALVAYGIEVPDGAPGHIRILSGEPAPSTD